MARINDYRCKECDSVEEGWSDDIPKCHGKKMHWTPSRINTPEWGGPKQLIHLRDEPFSSRGELNSYLKKEGLVQSPSAEKHGGARNEDHLNLGKGYSYAGAPTR